MRNRKGEPNLRIRALAVVIALLMLGPPIALAVFRGIAHLFAMAV
ncbi:MAG: hypothetical protein QOE84_1356 [Actinomycetota bacterium]|jgi:hypothetical protein|nr:hypothetical protein [Actinomycetota bacterium]